MKLIILGSGTSVPSAKRKSSGYLLEIDGIVNLLDCGPGALHQLAHTQYTTKDISNIFISHIHIDHIADLFPIFFSNKYYTQKYGITSNFNIYSSFKSIEVLKSTDNVYHNLTYDENNRYEFIGLNDSEIIEYENFRLFTLGSFHIEGSLMFKFTDKKNISFVYTADTGICKNLYKITDNVDYLLIECSLPDEIDLETHMTPSKIRKLAEIANPKNIILTHLYPEIDNTNELILLKEELKNKSKIDVIIANDLMSIELK